MKTLTASALLLLFPIVACGVEPWQQITIPTVAEAAANFPAPPREYGAIHWAIWGAGQTNERILADIEHINASGGGVYMINNSGGLTPKYFTPEYLDLVKFVVDECKKRGMKVWIEGDAGYPDGFAGGMIHKDYPQFGQQAIVADARYTVAAGQTLNIPLPNDTLGIFANQRGDAAPATAPAAQAGTKVAIPADGKLQWTAPSGSTWELTVHAPSGDGRYSAVAGQTLYVTLPPDVTAIDAAPRTGGRGRGGARGAGQASTIIPVPADGKFSWTAPATGTWEVTFVRHVFRSSPVRFVNREDGTRDKDSLYTEIDYLNPEATALYLKLIHEKYEQVMGDEFGKTILGFRLDETDYTGIIPWTPKLLETFQKEKGYDLQPYIAGFFATPMSIEARRAKADYFDVWSGMFRDNFYKPLQEWCRARNMDYMAHLNHEETMLSVNGGEGMITNEGSFWRDMRYMGVPGVDNLNQIGPGITADFPKLAASAAHLNGRALVWEEEGGGTGQNGKFIADYQFARGMNYMNIRGLNTAPSVDPKPLQDSAFATGHYISRTQYMLAVGRPAAQVALYHPTDTYWLFDQGAFDADAATVKLTTDLLAHQIDFDHIDADALATDCTLEGGGLKNLSGQVYRAVVVPTSTVIQKSVLDRLRAFAAAGGKVVFVGRTPTMVIDQTYLHPEPGAPDLSFATIEPSGEITQKVIDALPKPDVKLDAPCPPITYIRRTLQDGDEYFFFNESDKAQSRTATLAGSGFVQIWDATTGTIHPLAGVDKAAAGSVDVPLNLGPHEARLIVIGPLPAAVGQPFPTPAASQTFIALDGDWSVMLDQKQTDKPLGPVTFSGIADYHKTFKTAALPQGQRVYLDLGNVGEVALVTLNGKSFDPRGWTPFVWDVTGAIQAGDNTLEVQVQVPVTGGRGGGFGGGGAARGARGGGRGRGGQAPATQPASAAPASTGAHGLLGPVRLTAQ